ncbi:DUF4959 domain-containing protein [Sphingobacterium daejeonense]|uniref:DUF4959 domain-containing protein n=1 Tax=Sphingobacterium daejeonense TaxID=371142 RepID=UPI0021A7AB30|nr:DUF4959 domain-containing protein [Sphingobacterium daejeonense]MCT1530546.1 DUF4959 domain-containing protein [Sphingobacterium daejeonense]
MKKLIYISLVFLILSGCKEMGRIDFIDDQAGPPAPVEVKAVKNISGGAIITYKIPEDRNLLGVKAVYTRNGEVVETKGSIYVDTLRVEGFGSANEQEIELYSIGRNEKLSSPVSVKVSPLAPPVQVVKFDVEAGFGGVVMSIDENKTNADLSLVLMADTLGDGKYLDMQTFHTKSGKIKFSRRGLSVRPTKFAMYLRDRWNNVSDTIYRDLTPIEEVRIPSDLFRNAALPTDYFVTAENSSGYRLENLWLGSDASTPGDFFASSHSGPMPQWFTIDLGRKVTISRIQKWPREGMELYSSTAPRTFEVWGSENPNPDGSFDDSWFLVGEFEQFKPSGYGEGREVGPVSDEDRDYWYNRTEFDVVPTEKATDPYRPLTHVRIRVTSTFQTFGTETNRSQVIIAQLAFWGQLVN